MSKRRRYSAGFEQGILDPGVATTRLKAMALSSGLIEETIDGPP
jgi:hypothetical protein